MDTNAIRTYSLDRVVAFSIQENQASPPANLENYYYYSFGIYVKTDPNPQEVILKFSPEAGRYVKEAVLHHSQKVIEDSAEAFVVKLYLSISPKFSISPKWTESPKYSETLT